MRPLSSRMARSESCFTSPRSWETNSTVILRSLSSWNLRTQRLANTASPTARASSTMRISGSTWMAVENASRTYMPLEYSFTGRPMNSPISAKALDGGHGLLDFARGSAP